MSKPNQVIIQRSISNSTPKLSHKALSDLVSCIAMGNVLSIPKFQERLMPTSLLSAVVVGL